MIRKIPRSQPIPPGLVLLTPAARCPSCSRVPNIRVTYWGRDALAGQDPSEIFQTYRCQAESCKTLYTVTVHAIQEAQPICEAA